jgi:translocation and assembly module TamA
VISGGRDGIPSENLFRAGGAQSIRGYDYLGLGVRVGDAVVGGRVIALGSLEYQYPVVGNWLGALFLDVGNAADRWSDWKPVRGAGIGARWRSPIGPINIDLAHASPDGRWRMHFSVGYSF